MPKGKLVTEKERIAIVQQKMTTNKTITQIADEFDRSRATVTTTTFESLSPEAQAEVRQYVQDYDARMERFRNRAAIKAENLVASVPDNDPSYLRDVIGALKVSDDIVRKIQGLPTEIHEHRTPLDSARAALLKAMASGMFQPEQKGEVIDVIAKQYNLDPKQLEG